MSGPPPPQISPDGKFYWDGERWVPMPSQPAQASQPQVAPTKSHRIRNGCLGLVVLAVLLIAIGICNGPHTTNSITPGSSPSPAGPSPVPVALSGHGSKVISPLHLVAGRYRVSWTAQGNDNFIVTLHGQENMTLVNEIPPSPSSGETFLNAGGGDYDLEIQAPTLTWKITFTPI